MYLSPISPAVFFRFFNYFRTDRVQVNIGKAVYQGFPVFYNCAFETATPEKTFPVVSFVVKTGKTQMVKLESRPIHGKPWQYMFYADLETDMTDSSAQSVIEAIEQNTEFFKILGSYNCGNRVWSDL